MELPDAPSVKDPSLLLSAEKLAELLDISIRTLWRLRAAGKLPTPVRLGGSVRWRLYEVEDWIDAGCPPVTAAGNEPQRARRSLAHK